MKNPTIYAIVPLVSSQVGHYFQYHLSVQKELQTRGWKYIPIVPRGFCSSQNKLDWLDILSGSGNVSGKSIFYRLKVCFSDVLVMKQFLATIDKRSEFFFIEGFDVEHFVFLFLMLCLSRLPRQLWIMHRYVFSRFHKKTPFFRLFHRLFEMRLGKTNVRYLTDSELLAQNLQNVYGKEFAVLPIPHAQEAFWKTKEKEKDLLLWWPGGSIREEKGLKHIQRMAQILETQKNVQLIVAEGAREFLQQTANVLYIPTEISREEYVKWMRQADLILLPYSSKNYAYRSSGIFVEAISMGAIPVVSRQTWMAYELKKFDLEDLAIDWDQEALLELLQTIRVNEQIAAKLKRMRAFYQKFHSEKSFGETFIPKAG